jgi:hypothetical protein
MDEAESRGCQVCHSSRKPLLCVSCVKRGFLNKGPLEALQKHRQRLVERLNSALEAQVCSLSCQRCSIRFDRYFLPRSSA